ncbi:hypothetical protein DFS34DRAFT_590505 [Phlyctochytrium arcticum]|nr:hypothetical protein DFS34DRAFT_590505 [Phlyctochytrium arcticum]
MSSSSSTSNSGKQGFASMDKDRVREIASQGGRSSSSSHTTPISSNEEYTAEIQSSDYSEPAHNTRSQNPMPDNEPPISQTAQEGDEIVTYGGKQGFASMKETDPERQREIASMGGNMTTE